MYLLNILNMLHILRFFSSRCRLFHNAFFFDSCNIHILNFKENSGAKGLNSTHSSNWAHVHSAGFEMHQAVRETN